MIKKSKWFIFLILSFSLLAGQGEKINIAITGFGDKTKKSKEYLAVVNQTISEYLFRTKRFKIVDRENLDKVLKEKELVLSGLTTADETKEISEILNIEYLVIGDIVDVSVVEGNEVRKVKLVKKPLVTYNKKGKKKTQWYYEKVVKYFTPYSFSTKISGKFINSETGEVSEIKTGQASVSKKAPKRLSQSEKRKITKNLLQKSAKSLIVNLIKDMKLTGKIIALKKKDQKIIINLGKKNGLFAKSNLKVYKKEKINYDGKTVFLKKKVATLIVTEIEENYSEAKIFSDGDFHQLQVGQTLEVIERQFHFPSGIASIFIPGASQIINGKSGVGFAFIFYEAICFGIGLPMALGGFDEGVASLRRFEDVIEKNGKTFDNNGNETSRKGQLERDILFGIHFTGWTFTVIGAIIHFFNIIDATYPASENPFFSYHNKNLSIKPYFYTFNDQESHYQLGLNLNF